MLKKSYSKTGKFCRVTFQLPADVEAETASLCGDFNDWQPDTLPMRRLKNGGFSLTVSLEVVAQYKFRYLLDGERWENDWQADGYEKNSFGEDNSVVKLELPSPKAGAKKQTLESA